MADDKLADLLSTQQSLTEWLDDIQHKDAEAIRREDNDKRERLKLLHHIIGLPFDQPTQFAATDLASNAPGLQQYVAEHGDELCALRLIPKKDGLPKLRMRGKTVRGALEWFREQDINPKDYKADFIPHAEDNSWATIFIVNQHGIHGEIIHGGHHQLTQGFHDDAPPIVFSYDFDKWQLQPANHEALKYLKSVIKYIYVSDHSTQRQLSLELGATFSHDYLEGYFETTDSVLGTWYIDYNQTLGRLYSNVQISAQPKPNTAKALLNGRVGCTGTATGPVCIVEPDNVDPNNFPDGGILVCKVTTPKYIPLMQKAAAIVTDAGGVLSHAAIVARELQKPCVVATGNATGVLQNEQLVTVNATAGTVISA